MRIFTGFCIILCSVFLWLLPISDAIYTFQTDQRIDSFMVVTGVAETTDNVILVKSIYDDDTGTVSISSNDTDDAPSLSSYNGTTRYLLVAGLAVGTTRLLEITYDASAFEHAAAFDTIGTIALYLCYIVFALFPAAGLWLIGSGIKEKYYD